MTNPFYENNFNGQAGQTARVEPIESEYDAIETAFDAVQGFFERTMLVGDADAALPLNPLPSAANRANGWLTFDANGQPLVVEGPFIWKGAWAASTAYKVGDVVTHGQNDSIYLCKIAHTSSATFNSSNWVLMIDLTGLFFANYEVVKGPASVQAVAGGSYFVDTSLGAVEITLPLNPMLGDSPINVTHVAGDLFGAGDLTITSAPSETIMGQSEDTINVDVVNCSMTLAFAGGDYGWRLRTMG